MILKKKVRVFTAEHRRKISEAAKARSGAMTIDERRGMMTAARAEAYTPQVIAKANASRHGKPGPHLGRTFSATTRANMRAAHLRHWATVSEHDRKAWGTRFGGSAKGDMSQTGRLQIGRHLTADGRRRLAASVGARMLGVPRPPSTRKKIGDSRRRMYKENPTRLAADIDRCLNMPPPKRVEYLDARGRLHRMRSSWEVRYARHLDAIGARWDYEPDRLLLSTGKTYVPDFRIGDVYVEIKGRHWSSSKPKQAQRDGHRVRIILGEDALKDAIKLPIEVEMS